MKSVLIKATPDYEFYSDGKIWDIEEEMFLDGWDAEGYNMVCINGIRQKRHQLIASIFMKVPEKYCDVPFEELVVHHKDGDKRNNWVKNLEYLTRSEHSILHNVSKVYRYGLDGNFIDEFESQKDAANKVKVNESVISNCLNGKFKTAGGYQFSYEKKECISPINSRADRIGLAHSKKVAQYTPDFPCELIKVWNSASEAARGLRKQGIKVWQQNITKVCQHKLKQCGGFGWAYWEE